MHYSWTIQYRSSYITERVEQKEMSHSNLLTAAHDSQPAHPSSTRRLRVSSPAPAATSRTHPSIPLENKAMSSAPTLPRTAPRSGRHPPGHVRIGVSFSLIYNLPARNQVSPHPRLLPPPEIAVPAVSTLARPPTRPPCPFRAFRCVARRAGACAQCSDARRAPAWRVYRKAVCAVAVPLRLAGTPLAI